MSTLLLRLSGPLQSWGNTSRYKTRGTAHEPTRSGVLGLLAAAQGRLRVDPIADLADLSFGVRVDQPGQILEDFQTVGVLGTQEVEGLVRRHYLSDAVFVAAVEGPDAVVRGLERAVRAPAFPLYLGRRSCPPAGALSLGVRDEGLLEALGEVPWQAARWWRRRQPQLARLAIVRDAQPHERGELVQDDPVSFDPERRQYAWRAVVRTDDVEVRNPDGRPSAAALPSAPSTSELDFFAPLEDT